MAKKRIPFDVVFIIKVGFALISSRFILSYFQFCMCICYTLGDYSMCVCVCVRINKFPEYLFTNMRFINFVLWPFHSLIHGFKEKNNSPKPRISFVYISRGYPFPNHQNTVWNRLLWAEPNTVRNCLVQTSDLIN